MSRRELRILQVTAPGPVGGLESVVAALSVGLSRRGHKVTVSAAAGKAAGPHPFLDLLSAEGVGVVRAGGGYRTETVALRKVAQESGADLIHSHGYRCDVLSRLAARRARYPLVTTVHGFTGGGVKNRFYERLQLLALGGFDAVVAVSAPLARQLERSISGPRLHLVPNVYAGLNPPGSRAGSRERLRLGSEGPVIGWVGRLSHEKGPDVALRALALLPPKPWLGVFLGDGPQRPALERLASDLGISSRVRWMGNVSGAGAVMPAFDILLSSSRTEGTPVVLLEAAAAGVPIVATDVGGVPELLREIGGAPPVPPGDPAALAAGVARLLGDPEGAIRLGAAQRSRLEMPGRFEAWLDRYEEIYRNVLSGRGVR